MPQQSRHDPNTAESPDQDVVGDEPGLSQTRSTLPQQQAGPLERAVGKS